MHLLSFGAAEGIRTARSRTVASYVRRGINSLVLRGVNGHFNNMINSIDPKTHDLFVSFRTKLAYAGPDDKRYQLRTRMTIKALIDLANMFMNGVFASP